jgi:hypothetical protein
VIGENHFFLKFVVSRCAFLELPMSAIKEGMEVLVIDYRDVAGAGLGFTKTWSFPIVGLKEIQGMY